MSLVTLFSVARSSPRKCPSPNKWNTHTKKHQPWKGRKSWHLAATARSDLRDSKGKKAGMKEQALSDPMRCLLGSKSEKQKIEWWQPQLDGISLERWEGSGDEVNNTINTLNMTEPYMLQTAKLARHGSVHLWAPHLKDRSQRIKSLSVSLQTVADQLGLRYDTWPCSSKNCINANGYGTVYSILFDHNLKIRKY